MMENRFFKRNKINILNFIPMGICVCFSIYFLMIEPVEFSNRNSIIFYSFGLYFFTIGFNYVALRNFDVWLLWFGFSLVQIVIYYKHGLNNADWSAIRGLRNFWIFLIAFQILRWVSLNFQNKEFVTLTRSKWDPLDNRRFTRLDMLLYGPAIFLIFILQII